MASPGTLGLRLVFEGKKYLLDKFPNTRQELLTQALEKLKLPAGKDYLLQYLETETERIVITDDSDLTTVKSLALTENKRVIQVALERSDEKGYSCYRNSISTGIPTCASNCQKFDPIKYYEYLKNKIPEPSEEFETAMLKGVPCEECLGSKRFRGKKCEHCYGKGYRPITPATLLMLKLIDYKIREYVMGPLEAFCSKYKEEEVVEGNSSPLEKVINGGPSPIGIGINNIFIEPVPSIDVSILEKKQTTDGLRPVPRRGTIERNSEGPGKIVAQSVGNPSQHPPRKSSSREELTDVQGRNSIPMYVSSLPSQRQAPPLVPDGDRQNTWADKKMTKNQDSVNYNSLHKSMLSSQEHSNYTVKLLNSQVRPSEHHSMVVTGANDTSTRDLNKTTPGNQTFSRQEVKFELLPKIDPVQVEVSKGDPFCKLSVVNKSTFFWKAGMVFSLMVELEGKNIEDFSLTKEVQPEDTAALTFDLKKYIKHDTKACKGSLSVRKGVDEVQKLHFFSEKYAINIEFV